MCSTRTFQIETAFFVVLRKLVYNIQYPGQFVPWSIIHYPVSNVLCSMGKCSVPCVQDRTKIYWSPSVSQRVACPIHYTATLTLSQGWAVLYSHTILEVSCPIHSQCFKGRLLYTPTLSWEWAVLYTLTVPEL